MINPRKLLQERQGHLDLAFMESLKSLESLVGLPGEPEVAHAVDPVWHALQLEIPQHTNLERLCLCILQFLMSMRKMPTLARQDHLGREALQRKVMGLPLERTQTYLWKDLGP